ncbi:MAG: hypothetical protein NT034_01630 [Candidatus Magasanikbacteria bacterium]|nr:hypothetical protein [Candidatus Magasanikbacteria bacterium]
MKKYFKSLLVVTAVFSLFLAQNALAAPIKKTPPKYQNITTGNPHVMKNDKFFVSIKLSNASTIKKTQIKMDGNVVKTCGSVVTCSGEIGTFGDDQIGEHSFSFLITAKNGATSEPWGKFEVVDGDKNQYGAWYDKIRVSMNSYQTEVGKKQNILVYIANGNSIDYKNQVYFMDVAVDDEELMDMATFGPNTNPGAKTSSSGRLLPAFKKADIGEHTFSFGIKAPNGDVVESGGSFWIVDKGQVLPVENP